MRVCGEDSARRAACPHRCEYRDREQTIHGRAAGSTDTVSADAAVRV